MQFLKSALAIVLAAPVFGSGNPEPPQGLTVHEWGTFTSVAGESGAPQPWSPLAGPSDLPCFVVHLHGLQYKSLGPPAGAGANQTVTVRMETPVLYLYSPRRTTISVGVDFPKGLITEWYPAASSVVPEPAATVPPVERGHIQWKSVEIAPGEKTALPTGTGASHYYAARNTDSDPIRIGQQQEKLLFYRGIGNFAVPLAARATDGGEVTAGSRVTHESEVTSVSRVTGESKVELRNTGDEALALAILFENRGGQIGYRMVRGLTGSVELDTPEPTGNLDRLKQDLENALVAAGLYKKEAAAMIETWRDSWFEEGMRVFYLAPRRMVDRELPLTVEPAPASTARVFVGRVEMLAPFERTRLVAALEAGDTKGLDRFGRFLAPFLQQVKAQAAPPVAGYLAAKAEAAQHEFYAPSCVQ